MHENDLRGALTLLADRAPDTTSLPAQVDEHVTVIRVRRRRYALGGVAAAVVAVAGASGVLIGLGHSAPTPATMPAASTTSTTTTSSRSVAAPQRPARPYRWTTDGAAPQLPVTVPVPAGYTRRAIKFYPDLHFTNIGYSSANPGQVPFSVTVGDAQAMNVGSTPTDQAATTTSHRAAPTSPTQRTITGPSGRSLVLNVNSQNPTLERQIAAGITDVASPIALGLSMEAIPQGGYVASAQVDPTNPAALATVGIARPVGETGQTAFVTLTLQDAAGLGPVAATATVTSPAGRTVTVNVGTDTTSWILLKDGRAIVLNGYPLGGALLRDVQAYPQSSLLPLLAGATAG